MNKAVLLIILIFGIIGNSEEKKKEKTEIGGKMEKREILCYKTSEKITIDGKLNEDAWQKAYVVDNFFTWDEDGNLKPAISKTKVRVLWDENFLYIGAEMEDKDIFAIKTTKTIICQDDVFEIFIKPSEEKTHYYEFHITPKNHKLELFIPRRGCGSLGRYYFSSGIKSFVRIKGTLNNWEDVDEGWTVEASIPFSAFAKTTSTPKNGTKWSVAFCRYDYSYYLPSTYFNGLEFSSSAALSKRNFHLYEDYDNLIFIDENK